MSSSSSSSYEYYSSEEETEKGHKGPEAGATTKRKQIMHSSESERDDRKSPVRRDEGRRPRKDEDQGWGRDAEKSRRREEDTRRKGDGKDKGKGAFSQHPRFGRLGREARRTLNPKPLNPKP